MFKCINAYVGVKKTTCKIMQECITARSNIHLILDDDEIRSLCGALVVVRQKYHSIITINGKMNVWKCTLIFPTDTLQQKTDLKPFLAAGNTSIIIILAPAEYKRTCFLFSH